MANRRTVFLIGVVPLMGLISVLGFLSGTRVDTEAWQRHGPFWGGNPAEVYSHWLDMVIMSGNAAAIAWLVGTEAFFRSRLEDIHWLRKILRRLAIATVAITGIAAIWLDARHGERTVIIVLPIYFIPVLVSSSYLLRKLATQVDWKYRTVFALCVAFAVVHAIAQLIYEPSGTGAPNGLIVFVWLASVIIAGVVALVSGVKSGRLRRFFQRTAKLIQRPIVWGSALFILFGAGLPITIHAHRLHKAREQFALTWLRELESHLSEATVAELKQAGASVSGNHDRIEVPPAAKTFMNDTRAKTNNSLRVYIPINETDYLFLWANSRFQYCDTRKLASQIDQDFIDDVVNRGATHQTGLYSVLWSRYLAGTVLKDNTGAVKAICVIKTSDP